MTGSSTGIARDNHYVSQALLRRWSSDGKTVSAYRLLVSSSSVPLWDSMPIRGLAYHRDLYTDSSGGEDSDAFESWLTTSFEQPGNDAIEKVISGKRLSREDWHALARYIAVQDLRTPQSYTEKMPLWEESTREAMKQLPTFLREFEEAKKKGTVPKSDPRTNELPDLPIRIHIERPDDSEAAQATLQVDVTLGRRFWLGEMRRLPTVLDDVVCRHMWTIVEPAAGMEWPLTDHPVLRLNYRGPQQYDFGGGWGRKHGEIMMPLSPRHLAFVHIGKDWGRHRTFSQEHTLLIRRLLVERAHRWVFATGPQDWIVETSERDVNPLEFEAEAKAWESWHQNQSEAEA